jgi:hypothetical protein
VIAGPDYVRCIPHMIRRANAAVKAGLNHVIDLQATSRQEPVVLAKGGYNIRVHLNKSGR